MSDPSTKDPDATDSLDNPANQVFCFILNRVCAGQAPVIVEHSDLRFMNTVRQKLRAVLTREQFYSILWYVTEEDDETGSSRKPIWTGAQTDGPQAIH